MAEQKESFGAWKKQTAKGEVINFTINGTRYSMWKNAYKEKDAQPDFKIYVDDWKPTNQEAPKQPFTKQEPKTLSEDDLF